MYVLKKSGHHEQYKKAWKRDRIMNWVYLNTYPRVKHMDEDLVSRILDDQSPAIVLFLPDSDPHGDVPVLKRFFEDSSDLYYETLHGGKLPDYSGICEASSLTCDRLLKSSNVKLLAPAIAIFTFHPSHSEPIVFRFKDEEINRERLNSWIVDVREGKQVMEIVSESLTVEGTRRLTKTKTIHSRVS